MIPENMLRQAAARSCEAYAAALAEEMPADFKFIPTPRFQKRIKKLTRRVNHPQAYRILQRAASIFLAILTAGVIWLSVDAEAREAFFGWVREIYYDTFVYRFEQLPTSEETVYQYRLGVLPQGYQEYKVVESPSNVFVVYKNADGQLLKFIYATDKHQLGLQVDAAPASVKQLTINQQSAELLIYNNTETAPVLVWHSPNNETGFLLSGFLDEDELVRLAESVTKNKR